MKLTPMSISSNQTVDDIMTSCHELFKNTIGSKTRPGLDEREIFIPFVWIDQKAEIFWHIGSIEKKPKLDIYPCNNDIASAVCASNCVKGTDVVVLQNGEERAKCVYRAVRVGWILDIVNLYNSSDSRVKYLEKDNKDHRRRIYLRYQEDEIDYLVVFEKKSDKRVILITGYPVFYISSKNDLEKDYQNYLKNPTN